jgi:hypothetical protein
MRQMALDLVGEVVDIDHRVLDPFGSEAIEHVVDQWLAADHDQRLGKPAAERTHARAETRCEHHGAFRRRDDCGRLGHRRLLSSCGGSGH